MCLTSKPPHFLLHLPEGVFSRFFSTNWKIELRAPDVLQLDRMARALSPFPKGNPFMNHDFSELGLHSSSSLTIGLLLSSHSSTHSNSTSHASNDLTLRQPWFFKAVKKKKKKKLSTFLTCRVSSGSKAFSVFILDSLNPVLAINKYHQPYLVWPPHSSVPLIGGLGATSRSNSASCLPRKAMFSERGGR